MSFGLAAVAVEIVIEWPAVAGRRTRGRLAVDFEMFVVLHMITARSQNGCAPYGARTIASAAAIVDFHGSDRTCLRLEMT